MRYGFFLLAVLLPGFAQAADVTIAKPWVRYLLPSIPAAGYMQLQNTGGTPQTLDRAASPACQAGLMLHESRDDSGMAMMQMLTSLTIPPHAAVTLAPGGYHLMCMEPKMRIGMNIPVVLTFADGSSLAVSMPVYGAQAAP